MCPVYKQENVNISVRGTSDFCSGPLRILLKYSLSYSKGRKKIRRSYRFKTEIAAIRQEIGQPEP